jgi:hypothetical protein
MTDVCQVNFKRKNDIDSGKNVQTDCFSVSFLKQADFINRFLVRAGMSILNSIIFVTQDD